MKISLKDIGYAAFFLLVIALVAVEAAEARSDVRVQAQPLDRR